MAVVQLIPSSWCVSYLSEAPKKVNLTSPPEYAASVYVSSLLVSYISDQPVAPAFVEQASDTNVISGTVDSSESTVMQLIPAPVVSFIGETPTNTGIIVEPTEKSSMCPTALCVSYITPDKPIRPLALKFDVVRDAFSIIGQRQDWFFDAVRNLQRSVVFDNDVVRNTFADETSDGTITVDADVDHLFIVEIYDIFLRTGVIYVCNTDRDITFEGHKYIALPIEREDISRNVDNTDDDVKITMADATKEQLQYIISGFDFRGCHVRVRQILYPESLYDNNIFRDCFYGYIDNPAYENGEFSCTLRSRIPKVTVPRRTYQAMCNCRFGDAVCQMDQARSTGKIVDVLGDNRIVIEQIHDDDFWVNGIITIDGESRMIRTSEGAVITTYYPFFASIGRGLNYTVRRGCDKTFETCRRLGNLQHFAGFPSIPFETIYR